MKQLPPHRKLKLSPSPTLTEAPTPSPTSALTTTEETPPPPPHFSMLPTTTTSAAAAEESTTKTPPHIPKLKRIIRILKKIHFSLRQDSSSSPPTRQEQRLYDLIASHVNSHILLFYREDFLLRSSTEINLPLRAAAAAAAKKEEEEKDEQDQLDSESVVEKLWDISSEYCYKLSLFLDKYRPSIIPPEEDPLHPGVVIDNTKSLQRKQQLLDILRDLEDIGRSRDYAPPRKGQEIECYKKIRDWITFSLVFIEANHQLQRIARTPDTCKWDHVTAAHPHQLNHDVPHGHRFALAFDMMHVFRSLVKKCKHRVSRIFSAADATTSYETKQSTLEEDEGDDDDYNDEEEVNVDAHDNNGNDTDMGGVVTRDSQVQDSGRAVMKSRLECLRIIGSRFIRIGSLPCNSLPTDMEVRLYAQIAEHVYSSIWLFRNSTDTERITGAACHEVDVTSMKQPYCSSLGGPATKGNYKRTRERYLLEIVSYMNAMKSSCLAAVPTEEEMKYYMMLSEGLDYSFMSCPLAADHGVVGADKIKPITYSEEVIASLKSQLVSIYKSELNFLDEVKEESASIINMVRSVIMSDEQESATSEDVFNWLEENEVPLADKLKVFFKGRLQQLDQFYVILEEMDSLLPSIVTRLSDATEDASRRFCGRKEYAIVAREVNIARYVMDKMNHPISGNI